MRERSTIWEQCDFKSKFSERFEDHKKGVHEGIKYECDQCIYLQSTYVQSQTSKTQQY